MYLVLGSWFFAFLSIIVLYYRERCREDGFLTRQRGGLCRGFDKETKYKELRTFWSFSLG
jgi:hypothetical protein